MGAFGQGLVQGSIQGQAMINDLEQRKQQAELFKLKSKQLKLETDMQEKQLAAQNDLPNLLFKGPDMQPVEAQGPGAPVRLPEALSDDPDGTRSDWRWIQEKDERGPGAYEEGPRPMGQAEIPNTAGPWANLSPQLQSVAKSILTSTGGDLPKTMQTLQLLAPGVFPKQPFNQVLGEGQNLVQVDPNNPGASKVLASGSPKYHPPVSAGPGHQLKDPITGKNIGDPVPPLEKPDKIKEDIVEIGGVPHQVTINERGEKVVHELPGASVKANAPKPVIKEVDTPQGKQFVNVTPEGVQNIGQPIQTAPSAPKSIDTEQAIALEMFGQDYNSLAQPARAEVNKRIKQDKLDLYAKQAEVMVAAAGEREKVKQAIPEKPSGPEREKLIAGVNALDQLNTVADLYEPDLVGPKAGAMAEFRASLPENWGGLSPKQAALYAALATFKNRLTNLISGAAVSPDEAMRLAQEMPQPNQEPAVFEERWVNSYRNAQMLEERRRQTYQGTGVDVSGAPALPIPHHRFKNHFTENVFPSTVVGPSQGGVRKPDDPKSTKQPAQEDPRVSQLGQTGKEQYAMAKDKAGFLDRYFKALEERRAPIQAKR